MKSARIGYARRAALVTATIAVIIFVVCLLPQGNTAYETAPVMANTTSATTDPFSKVSKLDVGAWCFSIGMVAGWMCVRLTKDWDRFGISSDDFEPHLKCAISDNRRHVNSDQPLPCSACGDGPECGKIAHFMCGNTAHLEEECTPRRALDRASVQCALCGAPERPNGEENMAMTAHYIACDAGVECIRGQEWMERSRAVSYLCEKRDLFFDMTAEAARALDEIAAKDAADTMWNVDVAERHIAKARERTVAAMNAPGAMPGRPCFACGGDQGSILHFSCGTSLHARCDSSGDHTFRFALVDGKRVYTCPKCGSPECDPNSDINPHYIACAAGVSILRELEHPRGAPNFPALVRGLDRPDFYQHIATVAWRRLSDAKTID